MRIRPSALAGSLILLSLGSAGWESAAAANPAAEDRSFEVLESGTASFSVHDRQGSIPYSRTWVGPLFALQHLVPLLGGELSVGPLRQRHELALGDSSFLLGPGSPIVTEGIERIKLSQAPVAGVGGLQVPLDFLEKLYGELYGYEFVWSPGERRLAIAKRALQVLPATLDVVNLQGVTTLVFEFAARPRYRILRTRRRVTIELLGDQVELTAPRAFAPDEFVRDVRFTPQSIMIELAPDTAAQDYVLEDPFRIVFDVLSDPTGEFGRAAAESYGAEDSVEPGETDRIRPRLPSGGIVPPRPTRRRRSGVRTVVLDPGHGGRDTGALGSGGMLEKTLTLAVAREVKARLESRLGVRVVLTRSDDSEVPLDTRSALANQYKGDLFVSLHINASPNAGAHGAETYFLSLEATDESAEMAAAAANAGTDDPLYDLQLILWDLAQSRYLAHSQNFARLVQSELNAALDLRNRGVKQAPFRVLVGAAMPAVLVELGFLSNPSEEAKLGQARYRAELADALVRAVSRYKAKIEGVPRPATPDEPATTAVSPQ